MADDDEYTGQGVVNEHIDITAWLQHQVVVYGWNIVEMGAVG